jgi:hypothetical protein
VLSPKNSPSSQHRCHAPVSSHLNPHLLQVYRNRNAHSSWSKAQVSTSFNKPCDPKPSIIKPASAEHIEGGPISIHKPAIKQTTDTTTIPYQTKTCTISIPVTHNTVSNLQFTTILTAEIHHKRTKDQFIQTYITISSIPNPLRTQIQYSFFTRSEPAKNIIKEPQEII